MMRNEINFYKEQSKDQELLEEEIKNLEETNQTLINRVKQLEIDKTHHQNMSEENE